MRRVYALLLLLALAACAPVANGEYDRVYHRKEQDRLTQVEGRQDFRTDRQKTPSYLLP